MSDTRQDSHSKPWTRPEAREAMKQHRRIKQAHTEIVRCNVHVHQLHTFIHDEGIFFDAVLRSSQQGLPLLRAVENYITCWRRVNILLHEQLLLIFELSGYLGIQTIRCRKEGSMMQLDTSDNVLGSESWPDDEVDDEVNEEMDREVREIIDYVDRLISLA